MVRLPIPSPVFITDLWILNFEIIILFYIFYNNTNCNRLQAGGSPFVFLYDLRMNQLVKRFAPPHIVRSVDVAMHNLSVHGHITGIAFSNNQILANYSYDNVYLFDINKSIDYDNDAAEAYMAKRTEQQSSASSDMDVDTGRDVRFADKRCDANC